MWYRTAEKAKQFVSVCIIFRKNKNNTEVLLVKRADNNKWCIPGGHLENKEKSLDAAIREIKEETNLNLNKKNLFLVDQIDDEKINNNIYAVLEEDYNQEEADSDAKEAKWFDIEKLPHLIWDNESHIKKAFKLLNKN
jgi:8-oxo-dGTP diphosphatase